MKHGFTLIELLIALLIAVIVAALIVPNLVRRMPLMRRDSAVSHVAAEIRAARVLAISEGRQSDMQIDAAKATLTVSVDRNDNLTFESDEQTTIPFADPEDVRVSLNARSGTFDSRGMFSSPAGVWRVGVGVTNWGERYVYVFQAGQVVESDEAR